MGWEDYKGPEMLGSPREWKWSGRIKMTLELFTLSSFHKHCSQNSSWPIGQHVSICNLTTVSQKGAPFPKATIASWIIFTALDITLTNSTTVFTHNASATNWTIFMILDNDIAVTIRPEFSPQCLLPIGPQFLCPVHPIVSDWTLFTAPWYHYNQPDHNSDPRWLCSQSDNSSHPQFLSSLTGFPTGPL